MTGAELTTGQPHVTKVGDEDIENEHLVTRILSLAGGLETFSIFFFWKGWLIHKGLYPPTTSCSWPHVS